MSDSRWQLLEGLARTRGYEVDVNDDTLILLPCFHIGKHKPLVPLWDLSEESIEAASRWLVGKPRLVALPRKFLAIRQGCQEFEEKRRHGWRPRLLSIHYQVIISPGLPVVPLPSIKHLICLICAFPGNGKRSSPLLSCLDTMSM